MARAGVTLQVASLSMLPRFSKRRTPQACPDARKNLHASITCILALITWAHGVKDSRRWRFGAGLRYPARTVPARRRENERGPAGATVAEALAAVAAVTPPGIAGCCSMSRRPSTGRSPPETQACHGASGAAARRGGADAAGSGTATTPGRADGTARARVAQRCPSRRGGGGDGWSAGESSPSRGCAAHGRHGEFRLAYEDYAEMAAVLTTSPRRSNASGRRARRHQNRVGSAVARPRW